VDGVGDLSSNGISKGTSPHIGKRNFTVEAHAKNYKGPIEPSKVARTEEVLAGGLSYSLARGSLPSNPKM
jgi:hypothetical protein